MLLQSFLSYKYLESPSAPLHSKHVLMRVSLISDCSRQASRFYYIGTAAAQVSDALQCQALELKSPQQYGTAGRWGGMFHRYCSRGNARSMVGIKQRVWRWSMIPQDPVPSCFLGIHDPQTKQKDPKTIQALQLAQLISFQWLQWKREEAEEQSSHQLFHFLYELL